MLYFSFCVQQNRSRQEQPQLALYSDFQGFSLICQGMDFMYQFYLLYFMKLESNHFSLYLQYSKVVFIDLAFNCYFVFPWYLNLKNDSQRAHKKLFESSVNNLLSVCYVAVGSRDGDWQLTLKVMSQICTLQFSFSHFTDNMQNVYQEALITAFFKYFYDISVFIVCISKACQLCIF